MDLTSITTVLTTLKSAGEIVTTLREAGSSLEKAETKLRLAELVEKLADMKLSLADVRTLLEAKDTEISELRAQLAVKESLVYRVPYYWRESANGVSDGPFCQHCYDTQKKIIRLQEGRIGSWTCHSCKNGVKDSSYTPPQSVSLVRRRNSNRAIF